jgi:cation/acetate symporter
VTLVDGSMTGWAGALVAQPAAWTVPTAFATMVLVSLLTRSRLPAHVSRTMVRLHTPEAVELDRGPQPL